MRQHCLDPPRAEDQEGGDGGDTQERMTKEPADLDRGAPEDIGQDQRQGTRQARGHAGPRLPGPLASTGRDGRRRAARSPTTASCWARPPRTRLTSRSRAPRSRPPGTSGIEGGVGVEDLADRRLGLLPGDRGVHPSHVFAQDAEEDHPDPAEEELGDHQRRPAGDGRLEIAPGRARR